VKQEELILRQFWDRLLSWAKRKSPLVPHLYLRVDCPLVRRTRKASPRAFMHTLHAPGKVCVAREAAGLDSEHLCGLFLHELGHPMATSAWGRSEQEDADRAVKEFLGVKIHYKGDLLLEWVPTHVLMRIMRGGR
jgi:hypothetical protein